MSGNRDVDDADEKLELFVDDVYKQNILLRFADERTVCLMERKGN